MLSFLRRSPESSRPSGLLHRRTNGSRASGWHHNLGLPACGPDSALLFWPGLWCGGCSEGASPENGCQVDAVATAPEPGGKGFYHPGQQLGRQDGPLRTRAQGEEERGGAHPTSLQGLRLCTIKGHCDETSDLA